MTDIEKPIIFGIKNCDTMTKAFAWLDDKGITYNFHDYKKQGIDEDILNQAIIEHGWEKAINQRGTTWRQLPEDIKATMNEEKAINIAKENPSIIKRPLLVKDGRTHLGFKPDHYETIFQ